MKIKFALLLTILSFQSLSFAAEAEWNVLFFLNGKNNLQYEMEEWLLKNLYRMDDFPGGKAEVKLPSNINVLVEYGILNPNCTSSEKVDKDLGLCDKGTKRFKLTKNTVTDYVNMGRVDMGSYKSLIDFVKWYKQKYPAKKTLIYIFDHGSNYTGALQGVFSFDDETKNAFNAHQIAIAFEKMSSELKKPVELFITDMCMASSIETLGQMASSLNYYVASRNNVDGYSVNVVEILRRLELESKINGKRLAYQLNLQGNFYNPITEFSSFNLAEIGSFASSLKAFVNSTLNSELSEQLKFKKHIKQCSFSAIDADNSIEFREFLRCLDRYPGMKDTLIYKNLNQSYVQFLLTNSKSITRSGMNIVYFGALIPDYKRLRFDLASNWSSFLEWKDR